MALKNNQSTDKVVYLVRFADAEPFIHNINVLWMGGLNSALMRTDQSDPNYGLQLSNAGGFPFSYWQGFAQNINTGPNACAFAFNEAGTHNFIDGETRGSIEMAYVGTVGAGLTKTVTLTYRGL
jgi:hypothetical protein